MSRKVQAIKPQNWMDKFIALLAAFLTLPVIVVAAVAVWLQDFHLPFYLPHRIGLRGRAFRIFKLRSMISGADKTKIDTTIAGDPRVTPVGRIIRKGKLDELPQFWNVVFGDMVLVGPRPNVKRETDLYTEEERRILLVKPGITDLSSIVFSDLGEVLSGADDANIAYNQLIRPWKSRLALFYIDHRTFQMDLHIMMLTLVALFSRRAALQGVAGLLKRYGAPPEFISVAMRSQPLKPTPPPGSNEIVTRRNVS